jgi:hypothetical protein
MLLLPLFLIILINLAGMMTKATLMRRKNSYYYKREINLSDFKKVSWPGMRGQRGQETSGIQLMMRESRRRSRKRANLGHLINRIRCFKRYMTIKGWAELLKRKELSIIKMKGRVISERKGLEGVSEVLSEEETEAALEVVSEVATEAVEEGSEEVLGEVSEVAIEVDLEVGSIEAGIEVVEGLIEAGMIGREIRSTLRKNDN